MLFISKGSIMEGSYPTLKQVSCDFDIAIIFDFELFFLSLIQEDWPPGGASEVPEGDRPTPRPKCSNGKTGILCTWQDILWGGGGGQDLNL